MSVLPQHTPLHHRASSADSDDSESMWVRRLELDQYTLKVSEEWGVGIGGTLWEGAVLLCRYLSCPATFPTAHLRGGRLIELGAGVTGLPAIVAARLGCFREVVVTDIKECVSGLQENVAANLPPPLSMRSMGVTDQQRRQRTQAYDEHSPWSELSGLCVQDAMQPEAALQAPPSEPGSAGPGVQEEGGNTRDFVKDGQALADAARLQTMAWSDTVADKGSDEVSDNVSDKVSDTLASSMMSAPVAACSVDSGLCKSSPVSEAAVGSGGGGGGVGGGTLWQGVTQVTVAELDWRDDVTFLQPPFDVVLVADVLYIESLVPALLECLRALSTPQTLIVIAIYDRSLRVSTRFWELLPAARLAARKVPEAAYGSSTQADGIGIFVLTKLQD